jgi:hypothetical protein
MNMCVYDLTLLVDQTMYAVVFRTIAPLCNFRVEHYVRTVVLDLCTRQSTVLMIQHQNTALNISVGTAFHKSNAYKFCLEASSALVYHFDLCRSFSSIAELLFPLSTSPGAGTGLFVDLEPLAGLKKEGVDDDTRLLADLELLVDLKKPPKPPKLDEAFWWPFSAPFDFVDFF